MPPIIKWEKNEDWILWKNESPSGEIRIVEDEIRLPFRQIKHIGVGPESAVIARWRFGQNQNAQDASGNGHAASLPSGTSIRITDDGLLSPSRNEFVTVNETGDFDHPSGFGIYLSCWIKSNISDYSIQTTGFIVGHHTGLASGNISYAITIDTDNRIRGQLRNQATGVTLAVNPVGGEVIIDTNWHHLLLWVGNSGAPHQFVVDNDFGNNATVSTIVNAATGTREFDIASSSFAPENGFAGLIDELVFGLWSGTASDINTGLTQMRYVSNSFVSPVLDTDRDESLLSSITAKFDTPNGSSVVFSFRASDTAFESDDYSIEWTGFSIKGQILSGIETELPDIGLFVKGRFHQVRVKLNPTNRFSPSSDPLQLQTPILQSLKINTSPASHLLAPSNSAFEPGAIIGQVARFPGNKEIHKVTLNLNITATNRNLFVLASQGTAAFQAANFQSYRDSWILQPALHWTGTGWKTSGITIDNSLQTEFFSESDDVVLNAPFITYAIFLDNSGEYDIWGYGFISSPGLYWSFDNDDSHLRRFTLGDDTSAGFGTPRWTKIGQISTNAGGVHTFTVYLSDVESILLDQWLFTQNLNFTNELESLGEEGFTTPVPNSRGPFITAVRLRPLTGDSVSPLKINPGITVWSPSNEISASGKANYAVQDNSFAAGVMFINGVSIEFWQIGGGLEDFAAWNYTFDDLSAGNAFRSTDYGESYTEEL